MAAARTFVQLARACRRTRSPAEGVGPAPAPNRNTPPLPLGNGASTLSADNRNNSHCAGRFNLARCMRDTLLRGRPGSRMGRSRTAWALSVAAPWCMGLAVLVSITAEAEQEPPAGASRLCFHADDRGRRPARPGASGRPAAPRRQRGRRAAADRPGPPCRRRSGRPRGGVRRDRAERGAEEPAAAVPRGRSRRQGQSVHRPAPRPRRQAPERRARPRRARRSARRPNSIPATP